MQIGVGVLPVTSAFAQVSGQMDAYARLGDR
jgi:hypothetical protein